MGVKQINPEILRELAKLKPNAYQYILKIYPQSDKWFSGESYPTYNQLVELSRIFNVPFGYFFLDKLPKYNLPIPVDFTPSEELIDAIKFAEKVQDWSKDILAELEYEKAEIHKIPKEELNPQTINNKLERLFNIKEIAKLKTQDELFQYLIKKAEDKGVIVLVNSFVRDVSNNYRKLDPKEFKGFVLYDDITPVIFINNNDDILSKIYTLINGIIYALIGESAILNKDAEDKLKKFCDKCGEDILSLAHHLAKQESLDVQKSLGIHYSERFLDLLRTAIYEGIITYRDALMITGLKHL
jgi:transcriptional regulator with XRE-family HTH domain